MVFKTPLEKTDSNTRLGKQVYLSVCRNVSTKMKKKSRNNAINNHVASIKC